MAGSSPSGRGAQFARAFWWVASVLAILAVIALLVPRDAKPDAAPDPCLDSTAPQAEILFDLTKPVPPGVFATALRDVSQRLPMGVELRVRAVSGGADPPALLGGLCRPYETRALTVTTAKDGQTALRDCEDLPAQLPPELRAAASGYCARRDTLAARIEAMAVEDGPVHAADLMGAMERAVQELGTDVGPGTLFVVSDMLQHAAWYSHLDLDWTEWAYGDFAAYTAPDERLRAVRPAGLRVRVLYMLRRGLTDAPHALAAHWSFWRQYLAPADVVFEERELLSAYAAEPRMDIDAALEALAGQHADVERRYGQAEDDLRRVLDETEALSNGNRRTSAAVEQLAAEVAAVRRDRVAAAAERSRLQDEWDSRARRDDGPPVSSPPPAAPAATCDLRLRPEFRSALGSERYLGTNGANYGGGRIVVRYAVDAEGIPLPATLAADRERSSVTHPEHFAALAADAAALVESWRFRVDCGAGADVRAGGQPAEATVGYRQICEGAPIPRCRTAFTEAEP